MPDPVRANDDRQHDGNHDHATPGVDGKGPDSESGKKKQADAAGGDALAKKLATPAAEKPKPKDGGMLTAATESKLGPLEKGTFVEVVSVEGESLTVKVWSGHGGGQTVLPSAKVKVEPLLAMNDDKPGERDNYKYEEVTSILWGPAGPQAGDVAQGYLGDCYFNAAMGAVAAANPGKIKSLFSPTSPNQKSYSVTLHARDRAGKLQPKTIAVDTNLPTATKSDTLHKLAYSGNGANFATHAAPLWPALLEKAYAQITRGGYAKIGDGGNSDVAMEVLTGVDSNDETMSLGMDGKKLLEKFRQLQTAGTAVTCGSIAGLPMKGQKGFLGSGEGPFKATLKDGTGGAADLYPGSLKVSDKKGKAKLATDDGEGKISGPGSSGKIDYHHGGVEISYDKGKAPAAADDLQADYVWEGEISPEYHLYGNHEYMFESVQGDLLQFKNPWGVEHPKPIPIDQVKKLFDVMSTNTTGKKPAKKPGG